MFMPALQEEGSNAPRRNIRRLLPRLLTAIMIIATGIVLAMPAGAEPGYPKRPVTIMMPYGPGGTR